MYHHLASYRKDGYALCRQSAIPTSRSTILMRRVLFWGCSGKILLSHLQKSWPKRRYHTSSSYVHTCGDNVLNDATSAGAAERQRACRIGSPSLLTWIMNACGIQSLPAQPAIPPRHRSSASNQLSDLLSLPSHLCTLPSLTHPPCPPQKPPHKQTN